MIYVIGGTTASGKSSLAFSFAQKIDGVVINADAFAVYKELIIGTAKPTDDELVNVTNHLFNFRSISESFSIFDYQKAVRTLLKKYEKKRPVVLVGGSGLYIRSVLFDYRFNLDVPKVDEGKYISFNNLALHKKLEQVDQISASKIHPNNRKRVIRALAIAESGAKTKSAIEAKQTKGPLYEHVFVCLDKEKEQLNKRIHERIITMFTNGLRNEVNELSAKFLHNLQALQAIGYKEIIEFNEKDDEALIELITNKTIKYAKRQRTFFRNQFDAKWFYDERKALEYLLKKHEEQ